MNYQQYLAELRWNQNIISEGEMKVFFYVRTNIMLSYLYVSGTIFSNEGARYYFLITISSVMLVLY